MRIGILSDTHGLLRPEAVAALQGVDVILHAGDLGNPGIVEALAAVAPTYVVTGNIDQADWARAFPATQDLEFAGKKFHIVHRIQDLAIDPVAAGVDMVVYGHSHKPAMETKAGVIYLNPGAAGKRRFSLPISLAMVEVRGAELEVVFHNLLGEEDLP